MLEKVFHLLTGYAQFEVEGNSSRFFNLAAKSGFGFWGFSRREEKAVASCRAAEYTALRPVAKRCGVRLRCRKKGGLPFQVRRLWLRKGMLLGILCGIGIYWFLSGFVWGVSVGGAQSFSDRAILDAARESGVYLGARRSELSPKVAAHRMTAGMSDLKWVTVNTDGCFVEIAVGESEKAPEITDDLKWSNIVASRAGTIRAIEAERGRPEVSLGDTVEEGDLLISGLYQEKLDPYAPQPPELLETLGAARGSVRAETYREFTVQVSEVRRRQVPSGEKRTNAFLNVFGLRIPLGFHTAPEGEYRLSRRETTLTALDVPLPLSVERETYQFLEEESSALEEEALKEAAVLKLREAQRAEVPAGGRVVAEELEFSFPQGMCILHAKCRCEEEIGVVKEILVN